MKIGIVTLGCDKNTVDSEHLAGLLARRAHEVCAADGSHTKGLDAVVITTCGFVEAARAQSFGEIRRWAEAKRNGTGPQRLIVSGCLSQRAGEELLGAIPEIDGLAGVGDPEALADLIEQAEPDSEEVCLSLSRKPEMRAARDLPRLRLERTPYAFLKIGDGCDHKCAFCAIPAMKGRNRSVPPEIVESEARELVKSGARELAVIGQDLSQYGRDFGPKGPGLVDLLRRLSKIEGDFWIRLLYLYPGGVTDDLLGFIAEEPRICRYLDVPLQHLDPRVLKAMKRPGGRINGETLFRRIREALPGVVLRTTFLVGFPGETEAAFEALLEGAQRMRIDRVGAFVFSPEKGTAAAKMKGQVDPGVAAERLDRLMRAQAKIAFALNAERVGRRERVLFDLYDGRKKAAVARSQYEAPEVDGVIYVKGAERDAVGRFGEVEILRAKGYDLEAKIVGQRTP